MTKVNKSELMEKTAFATGIPQQTIEDAVNGFLAQVVAAASSGSDVALAPLGTLKVKHRKERQGRNLRTGEPMTIAAYRSVGLSLSAGFKKEMNK